MTLYIPTPVSAIMVNVEGVELAHYVKHHEDSSWFLEEGVTDFCIPDEYLSDALEWLEASKEDLFLNNFRKDPGKMTVRVMPVMLRGDGPVITY